MDAGMITIFVFLPISPQLSFFLPGAGPGLQVPEAEMIPKQETVILLSNLYVRIPKCLRGPAITPSGKTGVSSECSCLA